MRPSKAQRDIAIAIRWVTEGKSNIQFAIWELKEVLEREGMAPPDRTTIRRVLRRLREAGLLKYTGAAYAERRWSLAIDLGEDTVKSIVEAYEWGAGVDVAAARRGLQGVKGTSAGREE